MKKGKVFYDDIFAGIISYDGETFVFEYDNNYFAIASSQPISLTLPLNKQRYESNILFPFFDGLIPEGYLLEIVCQEFNLNPNDRISILLKACQDNIGNISVEDISNE